MRRRRRASRRVADERAVPADEFCECSERFAVIRDTSDDPAQLLDMLAQGAAIGDPSPSVGNAPD